MAKDLTYAVSRAALLAYARAMLTLSVHRQSPLPGGPLLLVANHPSCSDPFFLSILFSQPIKLLITQNAFQVPIFGAYLRHLGHLPVVPGNGTALLQSARKLLEAGNSVALFPEGRLSPRRGGFRPARSGAARLALQTGVPVVPIGIHLARERSRVIISRVSGRRTLGYWYLRGPYFVTIGAPMHLAGDVRDEQHVSDCSLAIMQQIVRLSQESELRATIPDTRGEAVHPSALLESSGDRPGP